MLFCYLIKPDHAIGILRLDQNYNSSALTMIIFKCFVRRYNVGFLVTEDNKIITFMVQRCLISSDMKGCFIALSD